MYRLFLIIALLNFTESLDFLPRPLCPRDVSRYCRPSEARHYGPPHNYYHGNGPTGTGTPGKPTVEPLPPANTFEDLAQNLATAESAVRKYCRDNSNGDVKEVFGIDTYILKYTLRDFKKSDISVKIKHRVIYVTANQTGLAPFKDLRVLPSIVNTRRASWALENNILKISVRYNVEFRNEALSECEDVNDAIIEVPSIITNFTPRSYKQPIKKKKVQTSTTTAAPELPTTNKDVAQDSDTMSIDDALSIIAPPDGESWDIDIRFKNEA